MQGTEVNLASISYPFRSYWAAGLAAVAGRLEPAEAVRLLNQALAQEKDGPTREELAAGLAAVAGRLDPAEAARVCAEAARLLNQALAQEKDARRRVSLAEGLWRRWRGGWSPPRPHGC